MQYNRLSKYKTLSNIKKEKNSTMTEYVSFIAGMSNKAIVILLSIVFTLSSYNLFLYLIYYYGFSSDILSSSIIFNITFTSYYSHFFEVASMLVILYMIVLLWISLHLDTEMQFWIFTLSMLIASVGTSIVFGIYNNFFQLSFVSSISLRLLLGIVGGVIIVKMLVNRTNINTKLAVEVVEDVGVKVGYMIIVIFIATIIIALVFSMAIAFEMIVEILGLIIGMILGLILYKLGLKINNQILLKTSSILYFFIQGIILSRDFVQQSNTTLYICITSLAIISIYTMRHTSLQQREQREAYTFAFELSKLIFIAFLASRVILYYSDYSQITNIKNNTNIENINTKYQPLADIYTKMSLYPSVAKINNQCMYIMGYSNGFVHYYKYNDIQLKPMLDTNTTLSHDMLSLPLDISNLYAISSKDISIQNLGMQTIDYIDKECTTKH